MSLLTVLRVPKRGTVAPETLHLPHVERQYENEKQSGAVFRRIPLGTDESSFASAGRKRKPWSDVNIVHLVEAQIGGEYNDELVLNNYPNSKRTRMTLEVFGQQTMTSQQFLSLTLNKQHTNHRTAAVASSKISYRQRMKRQAQTNILSSGTATMWDPLLRQVDQSLTLLFSPSTQSQDFLQHLQLIENNWTVSLNNKKHPKTMAQYLNHLCSNGQGTFLHALVTAKAVEPLAHYLSMYSNQIDVTATDSHGRTSSQIDQTWRDTRIHDILETYLSHPMKPASVKNMMQQFEYYVLEYASPDSVIVPDKSYNDAENSFSRENIEGLELELNGAYGYFNDSGELVLELMRPHEQSDEDTDTDSNDENFIGNDYPDGDEEDVGDLYFYNEEELLNDYAYDSDLDDDDGDDNGK